MAKKYIVKLTEPEHSELSQIIKKGKNAAKIKRANILLGANETTNGRKMTDKEISRAFGVSTRTIERLRQRFVEEGYQIALVGKHKGTPQPRKIDGDVEAKIIALTRMSDEAGAVQWSFQSIANQMVEQGYIESISHESVRQVLKKCTQASQATVLGNSTQAKCRICL